MDMTRKRVDLAVFPRLNINIFFAKTFQSQILKKGCPISWCVDKQLEQINCSHCSSLYLNCILKLLFILSASQISLAISVNHWQWNFSSNYEEMPLQRTFFLLPTPFYVGSNISYFWLFCKSHCYIKDFSCYCTSLCCGWTSCIVVVPLYPGLPSPLCLFSLSFDGR